jgi:hypothetical protein
VQRNQKEQELLAAISKASDARQKKDELTKMLEILSDEEFT